jgi:hypothetical protein
MADILHLRWAEWEKERRRRSDGKLLENGAQAAAADKGKKKIEGAPASMA